MKFCSYCDKLSYTSKIMKDGSIKYYCSDHALNISVSELSFIINHKFNQRFTDFVNKYRIEFVIDKIEEGFCDKFTVESLSIMAGFASKSTFNIAFKKIMNCTPSEFIGQKNNELQKLSKFV